MQIYSQFFILFALIGVGFFTKKFKVISNNMNSDLGNLILYISLPALIIKSMLSFTFSKEMAIEIITVLIIGVSLYLFYIVMSYVFPKILRAKGKEKDIIQFNTIFSNTGFMGYPVSLVFFGEKGLFYMIIINIFYDVFAWTFGVSVMTRHHKDASAKRDIFSLKRLKGLVHPCLIAVFIGLALLILSIEIPMPVLSFLEMLGSIASPLAMLFIGSMLADLEFSNIFTNTKVLLTSFIKLIVLPLMVFGILKNIGFSGLLLSIPVITTGMPAAATTPLIAEKYGNDSYFASQIVFVSTLFSAATIPFLIYIL